MSKNFRALDPALRLTHKDFSFLNIVVIPRLEDIQSAAELPNFRFEVANETNGERGVFFLRIENGKFDSDKHDYGIAAGAIEAYLRDLCHNHGESLVPVNHTRLQHYECVMMLRSPVDRQADPSVDDLYSINARNILALADTRSKTYVMPFVAPTGSMVMTDTDKEGQQYHRFSLILDGTVRFHAAPTDVCDSEALGGVPYGAVASMHPMHRDEYIKETRQAQGVFQFQGREYTFIFSHLLFDTALTKVISKQLLERALNDGLRKQFPFFQVQGMDFGASMLGLKFN